MSAAASAPSATQVPGTTPLVDTVNCWESGGPPWLFDATLVCGMIALVAFLWWVTAWSSVDPGRKQTTGERLGRAVGLLPLLVLALTGGFARLDATAWTLAAAVLLGTSLVDVVAKRRNRALSTGTELTTMWRLADRTARWGAPILMGVAIVGAVAAIWVSLELGHPC